MPNYLRMLRKTLTDGYDYLLLVVLGNVVWCLAWLPAIIGLTARIADRRLHAVLVAVLAALAAGPAWMGLAKLSRSIAEREDPRAGELLSGMKSFFGRGVVLFLVNAAFIAICVLDVSFWGEHALKWWGELGSFVVTTLWVYVLLFWLIMQMYCAPFIVRENIGVGKALKKSALLVLDNLGYSTLLLVQVAVLVAFMGLFLVVPGQAKATFIGLSLMVLFFLFAAFVSLLGTEALDDLMRKYEQQEKEAGEGEDNVAGADRPEEESASA